MSEDPPRDPDDRREDLDDENGAGSGDDPAGEPDLASRSLADPGWKVLGESGVTDRVGVLGRNTVTTGLTYGVKGTVDSPSGYGLFTPDDARVDGTLDAAATRTDSLALTPRVVDADATVTNHSRILVDTSAGPITVTLGSDLLSAGRVVEVLDDAGQASSNPITVETEGSATIEPGGVASKTLDVDWAELELVPNRTADHWRATGRNVQHERVEADDVDASEVRAGDDDATTPLSVSDSRKERIQLRDDDTLVIRHPDATLDSDSTDVSTVRIEHDGSDYDDDPLVIDDATDSATECVVLNVKQSSTAEIVFEERTSADWKWGLRVTENAFNVDYHTGLQTVFSAETDGTVGIGDGVDRIHADGPSGNVTVGGTSANALFGVHDDEAGLDRFRVNRTGPVSVRNADLRVETGGHGHGVATTENLSGKTGNFDGELRRDDGTNAGDGQYCRWDAASGEWVVVADQSRFS